MAKRCTGCGMLDTQPLGLNSNGEPYLACCPDNNYKEITAVEWLLQQIENKNGKEFASYYTEFIEQAKAMEKEQIIAARIAGDYFCDNSEAEEYYNETYNK